jgi:hypothetical protein
MPSQHSAQRRDPRPRVPSPSTATDALSGARRSRWSAGLGARTPPHRHGRRPGARQPRARGHAAPLAAGRALGDAPLVPVRRGGARACPWSRRSRPRGLPLRRPPPIVGPRPRARTRRRSARRAARAPAVPGPARSRGPRPHAGLAQVRARFTRRLVALRDEGMRGGDTSPPQADRLLARQLARLPCWLQTPLAARDPSNPYGKARLAHGTHAAGRPATPTERRADEESVEQVRRSLRPGCWQRVSAWDWAAHGLLEP